MSEGGSNPWKIIVIGCGVITLLACCCGVIGFVACGSQLVGPAQTATNFLGAVQSGNTDAAYDQMSPSFQAAHPKAGFAAELASLPGATGISDVSIQGVNTQNSRSTVTGVLTTNAGPQTFALEIEQVGEGHKISAITVGTQTLR